MNHCISIDLEGIRLIVETVVFLR